MESIVGLYIPSLESCIPSNLCKEVTSELLSIINHVGTPWYIALQVTFAEQRDTVSSYPPYDCPCNNITELQINSTL